MILVEVAPGYLIEPETAELHGWNDTQLLLLDRIGKGIEYCISERTDDEARTLLCVLMLTYEERFGQLPVHIHRQVEKELCTEAVPG